MYTKKEYFRHGLLLLLTFVGCTLAGGEWIWGKSVLGTGEHALTWTDFVSAMRFSAPLIGALLVHELGHLFAGIYYKVKSSLPFFIPGWLGFIGAPSIGTFGAVIKIQEKIRQRKHYFDIGIAGPLAGFVIALGVLGYGFTHLPEAEYIYEIRPEYMDPDFEGHSEEEGYIDFRLGYNLLFWGMEQVLAAPDRMPDMDEVIHYPYLFAGYIALFFTALNLLPIGQLDGGHVIFGMFPRQAEKIYLVTYTLFVGYAGMGVVSPFQPLDRLIWVLPLYILFLYLCYRSTALDDKNKWALVLSIAAIQYVLAYLFPGMRGYEGWLFFAFLIGRFMGVGHPQVRGLKPVSSGRMWLGYLAILIFILCFTPTPFIFE